MYKAILFDFDGTLVNTLHLYVKAYKHALEHFDYKNLTTEQIVNNCFAKTNEQVAKRFKIDQSEFEKFYHEGKDKFFAGMQLFPNAKEILQFLHLHRMKVAALTFASRWYITNKLKKLNIEKLFDVILSSDDVENSKPNPEMVIKACQLLKIKPEQALIVGDADVDIIMGKSARTKTALFFPSDHSHIYSLDKLLKLNPDFIIKDLIEIKSKILNHSPI